jgi:hypothetical protein
VIEPDQLQEISGLTDEDCEAIVEYADREALRVEQEERQLARLKREQAALERAAADAGANMDDQPQPAARAAEPAAEPATDAAESTESADDVSAMEAGSDEGGADEDEASAEGEAGPEGSEETGPDMHTLEVAEDAREEGGFSTPRTQSRRTARESDADEAPAEVKTFLEEASEAVPGGEPGLEVESSEQIEAAIIEPHVPAMTDDEQAEAGTTVSGTQPDIRRSQGGT